MRWLYVLDNPSSICRICEWVEFAWIPLKPLGGWRTSSHTAHFDRACSCGPRQALKTVCYSSHMRSQGDPEERLRTHWHTHTLLIEVQSISRSFQPILLAFSPGLPYRQTSQEEGRESRCLVCRWAQKYFPKHRKQDDICSCHCWVSPTPTEDGA